MVSEKKSYGRTYILTHLRTDATPKVSNDRWSRDQKEGPIQKTLVSAGADPGGDSGD